MASRLELHEELCELLGTRNAYFQPPDSVKMKYRCIKYSLSGINQKRANNKNYLNRNRYELIVIDQNPDSELPQKILDHFPMSSFERSYTADNLNHFVISLYY